MESPESPDVDDKLNRMLPPWTTALIVGGDEAGRALVAADMLYEKRGAIDMLVTMGVPSHDMTPGCFQYASYDAPAAKKVYEWQRRSAALGKKHALALLVALDSDVPMPRALADACAGIGAHTSVLITRPTPIGNPFDVTLVGLGLSATERASLWLQWGRTHDDMEAALRKALDAGAWLVLSAGSAGSDAGTGSGMHVPVAHAAFSASQPMYWRISAAHEKFK